MITYVLQEKFSNVILSGGDMEFQLKSKKEKRSNIVVLLSIQIFIILCLIAVLIFNKPVTLEDKVNMYTALVLVIIMVLLSPLIYIISSNFDGFRKAKVILNEEGVDFHSASNHNFIRWCDVEYVVITTTLGKHHIRFFAENYESEHNKMPYSEYPKLQTNYTSDAFVYMPYSPKALEIVKMYFDKKITNEYILYLKGVGL